MNRIEWRDLILIKYESIKVRLSNGLLSIKMASHTHSMNNNLKSLTYSHKLINITILTTIKTLSKMIDDNVLWSCIHNLYVIPISVYTELKSSKPKHMAL